MPQSRYIKWFGFLYFLCTVLYAQKTFEVNGENTDDPYDYMSYWIDDTDSEDSLNEAVEQLQNGKFETFDHPDSRNLGLYSRPTWFYLKVRNVSEKITDYWWSFYTHADTIIVYKKISNEWLPVDTLSRNKLLRERTVRTRALTFPVELEKDESDEYLVKIINPRHTQNSFVSFTTPVHYLLWEKGFFWTVGNFVGIFLILGIISLFIGLIVKEKSFVLFAVYLFLVTLLTLDEELMTIVTSKKSLYLLLIRLHPLPLSVIATCLNYHIADYIFTNKTVHQKKIKLLRVTDLVNHLCLAFGIISLALYMVFMNHINVGQITTLIAWDLNLLCVFLSIGLTAVKVIISSRPGKHLIYGMLFLLLVIFINPIGYYLNYSGILSYYEITYPNYFYWFVSAEFLFLGFLIGWRYKRTLEQKHKLELEQSLQEEIFAQKELSIQKEERQQIARDLHDDLGATINAIKLLVTNSYPHDKRLIKMILTASDDIRIFHKKLVRKTYGILLEEKIEQLTALYGSFGQINFNSIFIGNENLIPDEKKESIYNIISEILTNTLKHSKATEATIQVIIDNEVQLIAEDNGTGFEFEKTGSSKGMGIKNIHQRTYQLNGTIHISSGKGNTTYIINIPIEDE